MKQTQLNRGEFLRQLGMSSAALMSFYCLGTGLTSCSGSSEDPTPSGGTGTDTGNGTGTGTITSGAIKGTTTGTAIDFTIDLTHADFSKLKTVGEFAYVSNIIVANAKGTIVALSKACTHEGTTISFRSVENDFKCPNHGSEFNVDGSVKLSPATAALKVYKIESQNSGNTVRVLA